VIGAGAVDEEPFALEPFDEDSAAHELHGLLRRQHLLVRQHLGLVREWWAAL